MRVSIEHKEKKHVQGIDRLYIIDLLIQLSEAEKAIVDARGLYKNTIDISPGVLEKNITGPADPRDKRLLGIVMMLIGIFVPLYNRSLEVVSVLLFVGAYFIIRSFIALPKPDAIKNTTIPINTFFGSKPVSIATFNPVQAQEVDQNIRQSLVKIAVLRRVMTCCALAALRARTMSAS